MRLQQKWQAVTELRYDPIQYIGGYINNKTFLCLLLTIIIMFRYYIFALRWTNKIYILFAFKCKLYWTIIKMMQLQWIMSTKRSVYLYIRIIILSNVQTDFVWGCFGWLWNRQVAIVCAIAHPQLPDRRNFVASGRQPCFLSVMHELWPSRTFIIQYKQKAWQIICSNYFGIGNQKKKTAKFSISRIFHGNPLVFYRQRRCGIGVAILVGLKWRNSSSDRSALRYGCDINIRQLSVR